MVIPTWRPISSVMFVVLFKFMISPAFNCRFAVSTWSAVTTSRRVRRDYLLAIIFNIPYFHRHFHQARKTVCITFSIHTQQGGVLITGMEGIDHVGNSLICHLRAERWGHEGACTRGTRPLTENGLNDHEDEGIGMCPALRLKCDSNGAKGICFILGMR